MATTRHIQTESAKQALSKQLWLYYYNNHLYEKGIITEKERNRMTLMIKSRYNPISRIMN